MPEGSHKDKFYQAGLNEQKLGKVLTVLADGFSKGEVTAEQFRQVLDKLSDHARLFETDGNALAYLAVTTAEAANLPVAADMRAAYQSTALRGHTAGAAR